MIGIKKKNVEYDLEKLKKQMKRKLSDYRYRHTIGVAYTAAALAMRYGVDLNHAMAAGLLHDCAKYIADDELIKDCEKYKIEVTDIEKMNPALLHAKVGCYLASKKYHVKDKDILSAIRHHTTGYPDMPILDKILFVADYIEPHRQSLTKLNVIRKEAFIDLDKTVVMILKATLQHLKNKQAVIDQTTQKTYEFYAAKLKEKGNDI